MNKAFIPFCAIILMSLGPSCSSKLENSDVLPIDSVLRITSTKDTLLANGTDTVSVVARIPYEAGRIDVSFTTTNGAFVQTAAKAIKQYADSISGDYRYARVTLRSDTAKVTVFITAEAGNSRNRLSLTFTK